MYRLLRESGTSGSRDASVRATFQAVSDMDWRTAQNVLTLLVTLVAWPRRRIATSDDVVALAVDTEFLLMVEQLRDVNGHA